MTVKIKLSPIKMIIGLGNPGSAYKNTYHNAGYLFLDWFNKKTGSRNNLILIKSPVFMNESGPTVKAALQRFKIKPAALLVAHDDSDITLGNFKLSFGRNSAGHHGIESVIKNLKTKNFWRLRIGIRPLIKASLPAEVRQRRMKAGDFVLKKLNLEGQKNLERVFERVLPRITTAISSTQFLVIKEEK